MTLTDGSALVTIEAIRRAARTLEGITEQTPLVQIGPPGKQFIKAESLQPIGSFKLRGAYVAIASLPRQALKRGVIAYSSGNHAQGVARAARLLGAPCTVVMPANAPAIKKQRITSDGARIVLVGPSSEERRRVAIEIAERDGLSVIPPFDDDRIIAGQGTCGLEIVESLPDVAAVLVPIGGGGLASGVAVAVKALQPNARLIGVEPELAADARDSLASGRIVEWPAESVGRTIADGARTQALGERTFPHLMRLLDGIITVSEAEIIAGLRIAAEEARLVLEPTGALAIAAMRFHASEVGIANDHPVVAIASGGNVDLARYREYLAEPTV
jgi:threonine dehydratase